MVLNSVYFDDGTAVFDFLPYTKVTSVKPGYTLVDVELVEPALNTRIIFKFKVSNLTTGLRNLADNIDN